MSLVEIGQVIDDRYQVRSLLGYGGMAHVYQAKDLHLGREVALKVLRPSLTESDQDRFRREIRILAQLNHPNIVTIYDLGTNSKYDLVYFVMELIGAGPITELGPFEANLEPALKLLEASISVAKALAYVHDKGIIHRDLTPHNVMLNQAGNIKVMDFGLVHLSEGTRLTRTGLTLGTPYYMAPEQAKGGIIDAKADLYALGAVLYHLFIGAPPFVADSDQAVLYKHVYEAPSVLHDLNPHIPVALSHLVGQLLQKEPSQRITSARAVVDRLELIKSHIIQKSTEARGGGVGQCGVLGGGVEIPQQLTPIWYLPLGGGMQWPAALTSADGLLVAGTRDETVNIIHPASGNVITSYQATDEINTPVSYISDEAGGILSYASRNGGLYAVNYPEPEMRWQDLEAQAIGILPLGQVLYVSTLQGLEARAIKTGKILWKCALESPAITPPTISQDKLLVMTRSGWLQAAHIPTGKPLFKVEVGICRAQPTAQGNVLLIPEQAGDIHAFDLTTMEVLWSYDTEGELWATPLISQGRCYAVSWSGVVRSLNLQTGDDIWTTFVSAPVTSTPVMAAGHIYLTTEDGALVVLDSRTGNLVYRHKISSSPSQVSPLVLGNRVFAITLDGILQAYHVSYF